MTISNNDRINGYRLATLPIYVGANNQLTNETIVADPLPLDNSGSILTSQRYNFTIRIVPNNQVSNQRFRWVVAYGDPFVFPSYFTENSILAYGETQTFSFTFEDAYRDVLIRVDIFDPVIGEEATRVTRILKLRTTTNGDNEKNGYIFSFLIILFIILVVVCFVLFRITNQQKIFKANYGN
jgi:hypothetical protein